MTTVSCHRPQARQEVEESRAASRHSLRVVSAFCFQQHTPADILRFNCRSDRDTSGTASPVFVLRDGREAAAV
ncbi:hypothetical protein J6590_007040 [Homalodisca vitripennis]|nr:hypothetical protein J6590_007040 [Homalodisca vitripennis]